MSGRMTLPRRKFLQMGAAGLAGASLPISRAVSAVPVQGGQNQPNKEKKPLTRFQIACMTLPYGLYPLQRALTGIRNAGYNFVAWGTSHTEVEGKPRVPVMPLDAKPGQAKDLASRCRDMGLEPLMMFTGVSPDGKNAVDGLRQRILQAAAARIPQVLTFGGSGKGGDFKTWVDRFQQLAPIARDNNVMVVVKQHGGPTGTGSACAKITRAVGSDFIKVNYDAGNVLDYNRGKVNAITDMEGCAEEVRSFCIKDHRFFPMDQDCGPGLGEVDHYRLLYQVAFTGRAMPLCCENISAPRIKAVKPEQIDDLARRAREFLELVIRGIQA